MPQINYFRQYTCPKRRKGGETHPPAQLNRPSLRPRVDPGINPAKK